MIWVKMVDVRVARYKITFLGEVNGQGPERMPEGVRTERIYYRRHGRCGEAMGDTQKEDGVRRHNSGFGTLDNFC